MEYKERSRTKTHQKTYLSIVSWSKTHTNILTSDSKQQKCIIYDTHQDTESYLRYKSIMYNFSRTQAETNEFCLLSSTQTHCQNT